MNLSENWSLVTCLTNLGRIHEKLFMLSRTQVKIFEVKCEKSQYISHLDYFLAIIELVRELLISNMHNKFEEDT